MKSFFQRTLHRRWVRFLIALLLIFIGALIRSYNNEVISSLGSSQKPVQVVMQEKLSPCPPVNSAASSLSPLKFAAIGDSGSGTKEQYQLAAVMFQQYQAEPFQFVLMLGDNIYEKGDVKTYGEARFTRPYRPLLDKGVAFYPVLGNHDVLGGFVNDQLAFFKMPGRYYTFTKGNTQFWALDTNQFDELQAKWLEKGLASSTACWKVVYAHHPVYSSGLHGNSTALQKTLQPLLEKYRVDLYLAGHDHDYERFRPVKGVTYIVSGGGGAYLRRFRLSEPGSIRRLSVHEFMRFTVTPQQMDFQVIGQEGQLLDTGVLFKAVREIPKTEQRSRPAAS